MKSAHPPPTTGIGTEEDLVPTDVPRAGLGVRFGFTAKLVVMVAVPLAALVVVLGLEIADRVSRQRNLETLAVASLLASDAEEVGDTFQSERERSALYLSSGGSSYRQELVGQWEETDLALAALSGSLARFEDDQGDSFLLLQNPDLLEDIRQVGGMRRRVLDLDATRSESATFYSDLIGQFRASSRDLMQWSHLDPGLTGLLTAFLLLSDSTEAASLERGLVSTVLVEGRITDDDLDLLNRLAGRQEASLQSYGDYGFSEMHTPYQTDVASAEMTRVEAVRRQLADGDFSLDPATWFEVASSRIETLDTIEGRLLADLGDRSKELADEASTAVWRFTAFGVAILAASLLVAAGVGRRLSKRTNRLARVARAVQEGDFSQRADVGTGDELGTLAVAFNHMTDDLTTLSRTLETRVEDRTAQLRGSEARIRAMLEAIPDLIFRLSADGTCLDIQVTGAPQLFSLRELFVGKHLHEVLPAELAGKVMSASRRARQSGEVLHLEYQLPLDEELREHEARIVAIPGSDETMVVVRDITDRKADERRILELIRSKDEFVASISHELRTPLTAVVGFAELLRDAGAGLSSAEQEEMIVTITESASDISNIVEDLLVAARAKIDELHVTQVSVNLRAQLAQVMEAWRERAAVQIEIVGGSVTALGDPGRIRQILRNLLTNARRYGGDHIQVRMHDDGTTVFLQVCDDGPGIPKQDHKTIFEPYRRSHTTPGLPGSVGLGLFVSRTLARLMGGDLTYRYQNGNSIFEVTLPVASNLPGPDRPISEEREGVMLAGFEP